MNRNPGTLSLVSFVLAVTLVGAGFSVAGVAVPGSAAAGTSDAVGRVKMDRWRPDVGAAGRYAKRRTGQISFVVAAGRRSWSFNKRMTAQTASTIKVMFMVAYLRRRPVRERLLSKDEKHLLGVMIRRSDDVAATKVRDILGAGAILKLARKAKMRHFEYSPIWGASRTSAPDQARFMRNLRRFVPDRHWDFARRLLSTIVPSQSWGIGRVKPPGWKVYFKGGWGLPPPNYGGLDHQVALLQQGRHRIGVAILTQGNPSVEYGNRTLRGIAACLLRGLPD